MTLDLPPSHHVRSSSFVVTLAGLTGVVPRPAAGWAVAPVWIAAAALVVAACGSTASETVTGPTPVKCGVTLTAQEQPVTAAGGLGTITVATQPECAWTATSEVSWIAELAPGSGQGGGDVQFRVAPNAEGIARQGAISINGQRVLVRQDAAECRFALAASRENFDVSGGPGTVEVAATAGCEWTASTENGWIVMSPPIAGTGSGRVSFRITENTGAARQGAITIGSQAITVTQDAMVAPLPPVETPRPTDPEPPACSPSVEPIATSIAATGGSGVVAVSTNAECRWTASSRVAWITITSAASGSGSATVTFSVAGNPGGPRVGTLDVAGATFTVTQAGVPDTVCSVAIAPASQSVAAAGASGVTVTVSAPPGCAWAATSQAAWLTVTGGGSGTSDGTVTLNVAANSGAARTGTLIIGGQTFTVTQAGACVYSISPTSQTLPGSGGSGVVAVSAGGGCGWTAASDSSWVTITSGTSGTGNGTVGFTVAANSSEGRTARLTIAGRTFTVTQQAEPCSYAISPTSQTIGSEGGAGVPVTVTTANGCAWTAASDSSWVTITSGTSGTGNGTVGFTVAANSSEGRTARLTIAGRTFTLTQEAAPCSYAISPTSQTIGGEGGAGVPVTVTTANGCAWTAAANAGWLTVTSGATGSGRGTVTFTVAGFSGKSRSGTLTIAGQIFTVTQVSCEANLAPSKQSVSALGGVYTVSVSIADGCTWSATSNSAWITITSGTSGTGPGTVTYLVTPNVSKKRSAKLTIADETLTVDQAGVTDSDDDIRVETVAHAPARAAGDRQQTVREANEQGVGPG